MFEQNIKFIAPDNFFEQKDCLPTPIKLNVPNWFKKLKHNVDNKNVKGCIPFLESLTTGYLLKMPQDMHIKHNVNNPQKNNQPDSFQNVRYENEFFNMNINLNKVGIAQGHPPIQLLGSPLVDKNKNLPFHKILNPWIIRTPPGYSCLFLPPLNNKDDRFEIIPAIVNTDIFHTYINFPFVVNGDKYETLETTIEKGTPYVQVIPFKRDSWKMSIEKMSENKDLNWTKNQNHFMNKILHYYKKFVWKKVSWN
jgi:hypothetical protein